MFDELGPETCISRMHFWSLHGSVPPMCRCMARFCGLVNMVQSLEKGRILVRKKHLKRRDNVKRDSVLYHAIPLPCFSFLFLFWTKPDKTFQCFAQALHVADFPGWRHGIGSVDARLLTTRCRCVMLKATCCRWSPRRNMSVAVDFHVSHEKHRNKLLARVAFYVFAFASALCVFPAFPPIRFCQIFRVSAFPGAWLQVSTEHLTLHCSCPVLSVLRPNSFLCRWLCGWHRLGIKLEFTSCKASSKPQQKTGLNLYLKHQNLGPLPRAVALPHHVHICAPTVWFFPFTRQCICTRSCAFSAIFRRTKTGVETYLGPSRLMAFLLD